MWIELYIYIYVYDIGNLWEVLAWLMIVKNQANVLSSMSLFVFPFCFFCFVSSFFVLKLTERADRQLNINCVGATPEEIWTVISQAEGWVVWVKVVIFLRALQYIVRFNHSFLGVCGAWPRPSLVSGPRGLAVRLDQGSVAQPSGWSAAPRF